MSRIITLLATIPACVLLSATLHAETKTEVDGTWEIIDFNDKGETDKKTIDEKWVVSRADGIQFLTKGGKESSRSKFTVDSKAKPKTITFEADKDKEATLGIYEVDGETMKIAIFSESKKHAKERPTDFKPGKDKTVATYRRKK